MAGRKGEEGLEGSVYQRALGTGSDAEIRVLGVAWRGEGRNKNGKNKGGETGWNNNSGGLEGNIAGCCWKRQPKGMN